METVYITSLHLQHGGVEMAIASLANALIKRGYSVEILCTYNLGEPAYPIDSRVNITYLTDVHPNRDEFLEALRTHNFVRILSQGLYSLRVLYLKYSTMVKTIKKISAGVVISTRNEHSVILSKYGQKSVKKIAQLHHDHMFNRKLLKDFQKHYGNIDYFVLLTERLKEEVKDIMKKNTRTQCVVIPNFLENSSAKIAEKKRKNQIIAVGRLHPVKGFERLIDIWEKTRIKENFYLKIIGDGSEKGHLEELIREKNLQNSVILTGALSHEQVMKEMSSSEIYVMTSFSEAFPFVLLEAMENGLPIIAYDVRVGPEAIVHQGENGYLIKDGDAEDFAAKLDYLIENKSERQQMSECAIKRSNDFMEDVVMKQWIDLLER